MLVEHCLETTLDTGTLILGCRVFSRQHRPENRTIEIGTQLSPAEPRQLAIMLPLIVEKFRQMAIERTADDDTWRTERHVDQSIEFPLADPTYRLCFLAQLDE